MNENPNRVIIYVILILYLIIFLLILGIYGNKEMKKNNRICQPFCQSGGWTYGEWIGEDNCECYDSLILKNKDLNKSTK